MTAVVAALGWLGAAGLLGAYGLVSAGRMNPGGSAFQLVNVFGGATLALSSGISGAWPSAAMNVVWVAIGLWVLGRAVAKAMAPEQGDPQRCTARSSRASSTR